MGCHNITIGDDSVTAQHATIGEHDATCDILLYQDTRYVALCLDAYPQLTCYTLQGLCQRIDATTRIPAAIGHFYIRDDAIDRGHLIG